MIYWLTRSSYVGEYVIWKSCPETVFSDDCTNVMYAGADILIRGIYELENLLPALGIPKGGGMLEIEITEVDGVYTIKRHENESTRPETTE